MAQLVGGVLGGIQAGGGQVLFDQLVDGGAGDSPPVLKGDEQGVLVRQGEHTPLGQPVLQGALAGLVEKEHTFLAALAQHPELAVPHVGHVQADELGDAQAAVQKESQNAVVPGLIGPVHMVQKADALLQIQIVGQIFPQVWGVQVLHRVFFQQLRLAGEVFVKRSDGGGFSGPRRGGQARAGVRAVGMDNPVAGQVIHIGVYVAEGHGPDQVQIHVVNADLVQRRVPGYAAAVQLQKAEKIPQVQKIFVHRPAGVALNGLVIHKKIPQKRRRFQTIICHGCLKRCPDGGDQNPPEPRREAVLPPLRSTKFLFC